MKTGYAVSVTQFGVSPFSEVRRWDRSISCVFFNLQYSQPIGNNHEINIGLQNIEKGFRIAFVPEPTTDLAYQNRLNYMELPLNYVYKKDKYKIIIGGILSYMYESIYRRKETDIDYGNPTLVFATNYSYNNDYWDRYNHWDIGVNVGMGYNFFKQFDAEFTVQKHFIDADKMLQRDIAYHVCVLLGLRYRFLSYK
ncbi:MAG: outer membrane beta-barrel protein [Bacteroidota bacterium]